MRAAGDFEARDAPDKQQAHPAHAIKERVKDKVGPGRRPGNQAFPASDCVEHTALNGYGNAEVGDGPEDGLDVICGPLLNYRRTDYPDGPDPIWHGSVLVVAKSGARPPPALTLKKLGAVALQDVRLAGAVSNIDDSHGNGEEEDAGESSFEAVKLYSDLTKVFWSFAVSLPLGLTESRWQYTLPNMRLTCLAHLPSLSRVFAVPAKDQSFRMMFHSCNGFSFGTDEEAYSGPCLWNDVNRMHDIKPFHVMMGGGDQIYNDGVRGKGPLTPWTEISNPERRRKHPFPEKLRAECDEFYYQNYIRWYSTEPFAQANGQIPQLNIWDDHDIIDGYGSYADYFMKCDVFRGIGGVAYKYYCLFQHHIPPPRSSYTTDAPQTSHGQGIDGPGIDPVQMIDTFIHTSADLDPSYIIGGKPGPYMEEPSRSIYTRLGARIAFLGIDARTERTRHQVNYPSTYDKIFKRLDTELTAARHNIRHLILMLGIPIAYPRLSWVENLIASPLIVPLKLLNKRFGFAGHLFNKFDGEFEILDDIDDHYTAHAHKAERKELIQRLQGVSMKHSVRITILGGDVHLAAAGRFYSKPARNIPAEHDFRYMANVISSAITNKPPPAVMANFLARRNKIHRLDRNTHETLFQLFDKDPGDSSKTAFYNHVTMPSRNYAILDEAPPDPRAQAEEQDDATQTAQPYPGDTRSPDMGLPHPRPPFATDSNGTGMDSGSQTSKSSNSIPASSQPVAHREFHSQAHNKGHSALHAGEDGAGTKSVVAGGLHAGNLLGGLDVCIRVEIDQHDGEGKTEGYGFSIPILAVREESV